MFCEEREKLKAEVARAARLYIEAGDTRKDAQDSAEWDVVRRLEREAHELYQAARTALEAHHREHGCLL